jgi:glycosyltransferase involved in cell wall biosynthesis
VVSKLALTKDFDIIHAHDWITYPAALAIKAATGKPLVLHVHSLETDRIGTRAKHMINAVYEIEKNGMLGADLLMPVSHYTKGCAIEHYGIPEHKFRPVYNAIDPEPTYRIEKQQDDKIVLFLGRITFQKGPEFMAETAFKVIQKYPKVLFFVAGVGDQLDILQARVEQLGISSKYFFAGFLKKNAVKQVLAQSDVYFMPSVSEPFGLSALEAAQFDIPCVLSSQAGVSEVMDFALKADYWDTDKFANYIYALLNYDGIRQDMIENTREELEEISWDTTAHEVLKVYDEALALHN